MDEFYTINQTAIALKVHPLTVRRYIKEGKLKAYRVGGNIRVSVNDLRLFTQTFIPHNIGQNRVQVNAASKAFNFDDPVLSLRGKGMSIGKLDQE